MDNILQSTFESVIAPVLSGLLSLAVVALIGLLREQIVKARTSKHSEYVDMVRMLVYLYVRAAEQAGITGAIGAKGHDKLHWVIDRVETALKSKGLPVDLDFIADIVEAEVYSAFTELKKTVEPEPVVEPIPEETAAE